MKKIAMLLFSFLFLIVFSSQAYAYQIFNSNPFFTTNLNGYYIVDQFSNSSCFWFWCTNNTYSCFDVKNNSGLLNIDNFNSTCNFGNNFDFGAISVKMLSTNDYFKLNNGNYVNDMILPPDSKWCDQPNISPFGTGNYSCAGYDYMVLPKNKEGIVVLNYSLYQNTFLDPSYTLLEVYQNGITLLNSTFIGSANLSPALKTLIIPSSNVDRNITVYASWRWVNGASIPLTNITIYKFQFYTLDATEIRTDWTNDTATELLRYCGNNSIDTDGGNYHLGYFNTTSYAFATDSNNVHCGYVYLNDFVIARRWDYYLPNPSVCNVNWFYYTPNLFFVNAHYDNTFIALFEQFLRTQIKFTNLQSGTNYFGNYRYEDYISYNDIYGTNFYVLPLRANYTNAFRETVDLTNNSLINISNQNPAGTGFIYTTVCAVDYPRSSLLHQFFTSNLQIDNIGWYCSDISNSEGYILPNGTEINTLYCGNVGCNAEHTHCNYGFIGTYCSDNTHWAYSDINGIQDTGSCSALCVNKTYGIDCLNNANITYECIDNNGEIADCQSVKFEKGIIDVASLSCDFGNVAGFSCDGGKFLIGFMCVVLIIGSINGFDYIATKDHKFLPKELNILFLMMLLVGFTIYIPLFNPLLLIIIVIFGIILLASKTIPHLTGRSEQE